MMPQVGRRRAAAPKIRAQAARRRSMAAAARDPGRRP
jgi:hypothetical protein